MDNHKYNIPITKKYIQNTDKKGSHGACMAIHYG